MNPSELEARIPKLKAKERDVALRELGYYYLQLYLKERKDELIRKSISFYSQVIKKDCVVLNNLGLCYMYLGNCEDSMEVFNSAREVCKNEDEYMLDFNYSLALLNCNRPSEAYIVIKSLLKQKKDPHFIRLFGRVCLSLSKRDLSYVMEAVPLLESLDQPVEELILSYILLAKDHDKKLIEKALQLAEENGDKKLLAEALLVKGDLRSLEKALSIFRETGDVRGEARALYLLSSFQQDRLPEALSVVEKLGESDKKEILYDMYKRTKISSLLKEAIRIAEKQGDWLFLARGYRELSKTENEVDNLRKAVEFYEKYIEFKNK
ncbi:hypothetical protein IC006_1655 [Sulfuracidifex tepidarius]|uniref:Beta-barrel assembly-enhancing protease n=1 Tax=Sulfuracidifex tepidarius TaxID=1294262 RepID=A0A510DVX4_9CREN|nr:hypothetical protein [Sulfuracidifex tepidarius]BBG24345.1 hypothetical protein IC006_1655 [Sulfuracidifex tepidarius]